MKLDFTLVYDLSNVNSSLLVDSNQMVACAEDKESGYSAEINVVGDVYVWFDEDHYECPSNFPEELTEMIKNGTMYSDENKGRVDVRNNNWFELFVYNEEGDEVYSEVVDVVCNTEEEIKELLKESIEEALVDRERE